MLNARKLSLVLLSLAFLLSGSQAIAGPLPPGVLGGQIYATGGDVTLTVLPPSAAYNSEIQLFLFPSSTPINIANSQSNVAQTFDLGTFAPGQELEFAIYVNNTGNTFYMGPASRNSDGIAHAIVDWIGPNTAKVSFEDLPANISDLDYNDVVFTVCGGISAVPAPAGLPLLALGAVGMGAYRLVRRKRD